MSNFDECIHKSKEQHERVVPLCCNRVQNISAFDCEKRGIFPLTPNHCELCQEFEKEDKGN